MPLTVHTKMHVNKASGSQFLPTRFLSYAAHSFKGIIFSHFNSLDVSLPVGNIPRDLVETVRNGEESPAHLLASQVSQQKQQEIWGVPVSFSFDFLSRWGSVSSYLQLLASQG